MHYLTHYLCLVQDAAGEPFYILFRALKHQVDKGPVDAVTGKAKYTLNDNRLLREDVEYRTLVRNIFPENVIGWSKRFYSSSAS